MYLDPSLRGFYHLGIQAPETAAPIQLLVQILSLHTHMITNTESWLGLSWGPVVKSPRFSPLQTHTLAGLPPRDSRSCSISRNCWHSPGFPKSGKAPFPPGLSPMETPLPSRSLNYVTHSLAHLTEFLLVITDFPTRVVTPGAALWTLCTVSL